MQEYMYFAALNGGKGFVSFFDGIFADLSRVYIIKGGPGTGKSKLMRDIAAEAVNKNYTVEYFYCSADPDSLDGIIIKELNIGVLDGTAPHVCDPVYPGSREEIVNVGSFWKSDKLKKESDAIRSLTDRKSALYRELYAYLAAAETLENQRLSLVSRAVLSEKMEASIVRLLKRFKKGDGFRVTPRMVEGLGMKGAVYFDTLLRSSQKAYVLTDPSGIGSLYLKQVVSVCRQNEQPIIVSHSPVCTDRLNAVFLPQAGVSFSLLPSSFELSEKEEIGFINTDRFLDKTLLRLDRAKIRFCAKESDSLIAEAKERFEQIAKLHFDLEQIYISAMDFSKKEAFTKRLLISIFK